MKDENVTPAEQRLLVISHNPREAQTWCEILTRAGVSCFACADLKEFCAQLEIGGAGGFITEEAFAGEDIGLLRHWLESQPLWSDFPFLLIAANTADPLLAHRALEILGNVVMVERPLHDESLVSIAFAGWRMRRRQYQARSFMKMLADARKEAENANRVKSEFLANISHEIRTPMTVFLGVLDHLMEIDRNPEHRLLLELADKATRQLRNFIDDILDFSRIESKKVELEEIPFELQACVDKITDRFAEAAQEKNLRLVAEVAPTAPRTLVGDPSRLGQVLTNLVGNAIKFTHEGEIRLSVLPRGDRIEFAVADTGIGIPEEKLELLFHKFYQVDGSFTRSYGGTGLGLALSKMVVDLMGGEITVRSREKEGSVFTLTLPLKTPEIPATAPEKAVAGESGEKVSGGRILLAEDEQMIRDMLAMMLSKQGWQTDTAQSGLDAVAKWEKGNFDVIFMDLQMPGMNGLEATREIRKREAERGQHICIIGLTARTLHEIEDDCRQVGMDQVLTKPVNMKALNAAICNCLSK